MDLVERLSLANGAEARLFRDGIGWRFELEEGGNDLGGGVVREVFDEGIDVCGVVYTEAGEQFPPSRLPPSDCHRTERALPLPP